MTDLADERARVRFVPGQPDMWAFVLFETLVFTAYFGFYLLAMGQGRPRRAGELAAMLVEAGFVRPRAIQTRLPLVTSVMVAEASSS